MQCAPIDKILPGGLYGVLAQYCAEKALAAVFANWRGRENSKGFGLLVGYLSRHPAVGS
jgi:hypothetical protein